MIENTEVDMRRRRSLKIVHKDIGSRFAYLQPSLLLRLHDLTLLSSSDNGDVQQDSICSGNGVVILVNNTHEKRNHTTTS